jgi:hyaluronoglucosaminidase
MRKRLALQPCPLIREPPVVVGSAGACLVAATPVDLATGTAGQAVQVGCDPVAIAMTADSGTDYVPDYQDGTVTPIDLASGTAGQPISVGEGPAAIAISP